MSDNTAQQMQSPSSPSTSPIDLGYISQRAQEVMKDPGTFFAKVRSENESIADIYRRYVIPLAAIPPIGQFVSMAVYGISIPFVGTFRWPIVSGLVYSVVMYAVILLMVRLIALAYEKLAPTFGGSITPENSVKLVAYGFTPAFLAALLQLIPVTILGVVGALIGLYSLYLIYQGIPPLTGISEKRVPYFASAIVASIVIGIVINLLTYPFAPSYPMPGLNPEDFQRSVDQLQKLVPQGQ